MIVYLYTIFIKIHLVKI